ncbi:hypothetical protein BDF14DRAFT_1875130 [Spinellus fusiger]|nr:hypothetical protein BDF14DRAFT_1875130 [Spinellus fusiger]
MSDTTHSPDIVETSKEAFLQLLSQLNDTQFHSFDTFVRSALEEYHGQVHNSSHGHHDHSMSSEKEEEIEEEENAPGEFQPFSDFTTENTVHVDGFLFTEEDIDEMCDNGQVSRNYCLDCKSHRTSPLNFISHSASVLQLQFLYQVVLADKIKDKVIVDVGSRLGAVLYSGYLLTRARKLIGIEINAWFSQLQKSIVSKYAMGDRINIINKDVQDVPELLSKEADIIVMNNVFQFFNQPAVQQKIWKFIKSETAKKPGLLIVTLPSLQEQLKEAELSATKLMKGWVKEVKLDYSSGWFHDDLNEDELYEIKQVHMYKVL